MGAEKYPTPRFCPATIEFCKSGPSKAAKSTKMSVPPTDHVKVVRSGWIRNHSALLSAAESLLTLQHLADVGGFAP